METNKKLTEREIRSLIREEAIGNIAVLIDPKRKDSFSNSRVQTFGNLISDRLYTHLFDDVNS
ncbi:hypothetical protein OAA15_00450 [bacterium]|nr:hypothetical protein [bacterium]